MIYVVTSFDFGGSSNVKLHVATADASLAQEVYESVLDACNLKNAAYASTGGARMLVELTQIQEDTKLLGDDAHTLFWGGGAQNNNGHSV